MTAEVNVEPNHNESAETSERTRSGRYYRPLVDIVEFPHELRVVADMPGVRPDDIDIRFENGELTIHGKVLPRQESVQYLLEEYGTGDYYRTFRVSEEIDANRISAHYATGVLTLTLPKVEAVKPRKITVQAT